MIEILNQKQINHHTLDDAQDRQPVDAIQQILHPSD
jgi:hypothetical protein